MLTKAARLLGFERKASPSVSPDATDSESTSWLAEIFGARRSVTGVSVTPDSAMRCPTAYACVAVLSQAVAQLPLHLYGRTAEGGKVRATKHPLHALLSDQPNDWTSAFEFRQAMMSSALRYDQGAFAWIGRVGGEIQELVQIPSPAVSVETDPYTREPIYKVTERNGRQRTYDRTDILHLKPLDGIAPLTAAREAIAVMMVMERHAAKLFGKGARPSGVLTLPKGLSVEALRKAAASWNRAHGAEGASGTAFMEDGTTWQQLQFSSVDAQFMELRREQVIDIARPFRIPPPLLQELGRATWSNTEQLGQQFLTLCLMPWLKQWEGAIRRSLLNADERQTYFAEFLVDDIVRADLAARMAAYAQAITNGVLNPNEVRAMENRTPYPGGEEFRRPMNTEKPGAAE
ncbi:phage portal protein [Brevundimonas faecalis]|uniref:phage portal protein n=1 Tax=Brevundimonas faecalis TaxID=947378 RepID=UPI00367271D7